MPRSSATSYDFHSLDQWQACLQDRIVTERKAHSALLSIMQPWQAEPVTFESQVIGQPFYRSKDELLWAAQGGFVAGARSDKNCLGPLPVDDWLVQSKCIVVSDGYLWSWKSDSIIQAHDNESFTLCHSFTLPMRIIDVAAYVDNSVLILGINEERTVIWRLNCQGRCAVQMESLPVRNAIAFAYLSSRREVVILTGGDRPGLHWFELGSHTATQCVPVTRYSNCFTADRIASMGGNEIVLVGADIEEHHGAVIVDAEGLERQRLSWRQDWGAAIGLASDAAHLAIATRSGVLEFGKTEHVPTSLPGIDATVLTPVLRASHRSSAAPWLRADIQVHLPAGSQLNLFVLSTNDPETRAQLEAVGRDRSSTIQSRWHTFLAHPDLTSKALAFSGSDGGDDAFVTCAVPLFDVLDEYIWVGIQLIANGGAAVPKVQRLQVYYHCPSLMDYLPAIYQRDATSPGNFLRSLIGVIETSSQALDKQIEDLGTLIAPEHANDQWLDYMASWLGVPWNQNLSTLQKRAVLDRAEELTSLRGTRLGLVALLACVMGATNRFRIGDETADNGFAVLGGAECRGSELPALIGGEGLDSATLDSQAILSKSYLPLQDQTTDPAASFCGRIRILLAASARERRCWEEWIEPLIAQVMPLGTSLEIHWVGPQFFDHDRLEMETSLTDLRAARLGTDAVTGLAVLASDARLANRIGPVLPSTNQQ